MRKISYIIVVALLSSCWKEEIPIEKKPLIGERMETIAMGTSYAQVVWFDLASQAVVKERNKLEWDFTLEFINDELCVRLNESTYSMASSTDQSDLTQNFEISSLQFKADEQSGLVDSLSIGKKMNNGTVFVLTRGYDSDGLERAPYYLQLTTTSDPAQLHYRALGTSEITSISLNIPSNKTIAVNLENQSVFELVDSPWDLCFTQYVHVFYEPEYTPYQVTGVLQHVANGVLVKEIRDKNYENITSEDALFSDTSMHQDVIGYDWKFFDLDAGTYTIDNGVTYLIQDEDSRIFKLQFLDFYSDQGERGHPSFKYEEL